MAIETTLRTTAAGGSGSTLGTRTSAAARLVKSRAAEPAAEAGSSDKAASGSASAPAPLRSNSASIGGALQDQVARAQQALDYLEQVASQLEAVKGELSSKLASARSASRQQTDSQASAQLSAKVRQLASTLASRRKHAGGGVDANLNFTSKPAVQRFRIRGLDLASLRSSGPQSLAFSVGGNGGPQLSVNIDPDQTDEAIAAAINRAVAPMRVNAGLDGQGALVFTTSEASWPAVKDSIAISGRGRVATDEVPAELAPALWNTGGGENGSNGSNGDALRASLREVVQALERVRRSRDAASSALSAASAEMTQATTPPPQVAEAAQEFASTATNPDYESLLSLTSALVGISRERVLALLGLK
jgi:flavin-binding protein dodecin